MMKIKNLLIKNPFISSIIAVFLSYIFSLPPIYLILEIQKNIKNHLIYNSFTFLIEFINAISAFLVVLIFKNLKIYTRKNFFKTLKVSLFYLIIELINASYFVILTLNKNKEFGSFPKIILGIVILVFGIGFFEESIYRGLILNIFAKKYIDKPHGILKILIFPALIFGFIHIINYFFYNVKIEKVIFQMIICFFAGVIFNAIYIRGGNIFILILIHAISDIAATFETLFFKNNDNFGCIINKEKDLLDWILSLSYFPMVIVLTIFLLRKSKLKEAKENLKKINLITN